MTQITRHQTLIQSKSITSASFHNPLPLQWHTYVWPFAILYPVWGYIYVAHYDTYIGSEEWTFVSLGSLIAINALIFLVGEWSVSVKAIFTCTKVSVSTIRFWISSRPYTLDGIPDADGLSLI
jgi:cation-transporting ATPase 13A1